jgi:hypothetical protein
MHRETSSSGSRQIAFESSIGVVRKRLFALLATAVGAACGPASAAAAPVLVLGPGGHVALRQDRFLPRTQLDPHPGRGRARAGVAATRRHPAPQRTVRSELLRLSRSGAISPAHYHRYRGSFEAALRTVRKLGGTRAYELQGVVTNLHNIAVAGLLTRSRLPALFLTLDRNRQWWSTGPLLSSGDRVEFAGSEVLWEYYPGQGIELQVLGNFGKADGLYTGGPADYPRLRRLLAELIPLAAARGGGVTWEYYFSFDGGAPPWTSAMSQGTALEALTRGYKAFGDRSYLDVARRALPIFHVSPPIGVAVHTQLGARYLLYSFAPGAPVINGFLQTLIGLFDYAHASHVGDASRLFAAGDAEARAELPTYDTGAWSLYQPGQEDTLEYHKLVTGFVHQLCTRTRATVYCTTARHFDSDLTTSPALQLLTHRTRRGLATTIRFSLSKESHVGIVMERGGQTVFQTSADFGYGANSFAVPAPGHTGSYTIRLTATDLAGNFNRIVGTLQVN